MKTLALPVLSAVAAVLSSGETHAQYFEARNAAMGGVGVASSDYLAAGWANPALLTRRGESDDFGILLPAFGARFFDETGLLEDIDDFVDAYDALEANPSADPNDYADLANQLGALSNRGLDAELGAGLMFAAPSESLGWALHVRTYADLQALTQIDDQDVDAIRDALANNLGTLPTLASEVRLIGVNVTEVGLSLATKLDLGGFALAVGATPKFQRIDTYNYSVNANNFEIDDFDDDRYRNDDSGFNVDVGAAFDTPVGITVGLMVRDLIARTYQTEAVGVGPDSFTYEIGPQATLGAAWTFGMLTLAADADLLVRERFDDAVLANSVEGLADDIQLVRVGAELDLASWIQLRGGYQFDIEDNLDGVITAGLGISPFDVIRLDLSASYIDEESFGFAAQFGLQF
ncbi:MAG: hypothetical protein RL562_1870 [Planctomycetota bacterium]